MAGPQLVPFYLQRCPLHSCQVDRIEKCPSTKSAACSLRNPYPVSVWCNSVAPCIDEDNFSSTVRPTENFRSYYSDAEGNLCHGNAYNKTTLGVSPVSSDLMMDDLIWITFPLLYFTFNIGSSLQN